MNKPVEMGIFKQLSKKGYKHYYGGTVEELDSMDKNNQHLYSEIMQVIMWLYEKHGIWIEVFWDVVSIDGENELKWYFAISNIGDIEKDNISGRDLNFESCNPTDAYQDAIIHVLKNKP